MKASSIPVMGTLALAAVAHAATILVAPDGSGEYPTIQAAVDAAIPGDEIVLASGVFIGEGNRNIDFGGKELTVRSQSGDAASCVIDVQGDYDGISDQGFYFHSNEGPGAVVRDLTITNGVADGA